MPEAHGVLLYHGEFTLGEFERISQGLIPQQMEDRWFASVEQDVLYIHRSWTGFCIYQVSFEERDGKHVVTEALVNRDPEQYRENDDQYDVKFLDYLIRRSLLGQRVRFPRRYRPWWRFW